MNLLGERLLREELPPWAWFGLLSGPVFQVLTVRSVMTFISLVMAAEKVLQPGALPLLGLAAAVGGGIALKGPIHSERLIIPLFRDEPGLAMFCRNVTI